VQAARGYLVLYLNRANSRLKGTSTMPHFRCKSIALVAIVIVLIGSSNLPLTRGLATNGDVDPRLLAATSKFSFKLYDQILKRRTDKNTFVSPASIMLALAMTYNGANGTTRRAMSQALQLEGMSLEDVNRAFADLKSALAPSDPKVQLKIANSLWARNGFAVKPAFLERNKQYYGAEIASLNFADPAAPDAINSWVKKNTEGKIDKIINAINGDDVLFLVNAIYFKGQWQFEFSKEKTKPDVFRLAGGEKKEVPMMSQSGSYFYSKGKNFQAIALPYGKGDVSMYVFLPDDQTGLDQFEQDLTAENWDMWMKSFSVRPGEVMLPRFKIEWEANLNKALADLGMAEAFNPGQADFTQIAEPLSGDKIFISEVKHKSWCEVNEEGTVAAAATSVRATLTSLPPPPFVMKVDRPFFFAIRDNRSGVLLFMGSVTNPG
jgi:serine protease inhibitor